MQSTVFRNPRTTRSRGSRSAAAGTDLRAVRRFGGGLRESRPKFATRRYRITPTVRRNQRFQDNTYGPSLIHRFPNRTARRSVPAFVFQPSGCSATGYRIHPPAPTLRHSVTGLAVAGAAVARIGSVSVRRSVVSVRRHLPPRRTSPKASHALRILSLQNVRG